MWYRLLLVVFLAGCGAIPKSEKTYVPPPRSEQPPVSVLTDEQRSQLVLFSMSLLDIKYTWGGKKLTSGLDCSGLVSYVYHNAINKKLTGNTKDLARKTQSVDPKYIKPGDLVFFNTLNTPYSHVGVYIGNNKFIHAPSSKSKIRVDRLDTGFYSKKLEAVHVLHT